ncbi:class I SAM-dependent methyltransferase [Microcoleus sp. FACHB-SPT15]|uniref:class I SAM-dependent methyltransferase n=1 Tax=Microcoleus sp. FACHB-SPT15 TaxID=2692830 RepID=UPI0017877B37|nr:class I SAM-dependent methyltransferase [Microcoleus sp. FACHB-SPT15]MBD1806553.1 class I SAM-dependent methyltransferase [Microcoleus sp. FACHB-SPT15]
MISTFEQEVKESEERFEYHQNILSDLGVNFNSESMILDFGCGSGYLVYHYRKHGLNTFGVDIKDSYTKIQNLLQHEETSPSISSSFHKLDLNNYRIPFDDNTFDFVFSDQVFEHVQNFSEALGEIKRVLKPGGCSLHFFPPKYRIIEGHVFVPLAGAFQGYNYLLFWALLGIRNQFQQGLDFRTVANLNFEYLNKETNYPSPAEVKKHFTNHFQDVVFVEELLIKHHPNSTGYLYSLTRKFPLLPFLVRNFQAKAIFVRKN